MKVLGFSQNGVSGKEWTHAFLVIACPQEAMTKTYCSSKLYTQMEIFLYYLSKKWPDID